MVENIVKIVLLLAFVYASYADLTKRIIPNRIVAFIVAASLYLAYNKGLHVFLLNITSCFIIFGFMYLIAAIASRIPVNNRVRAVASKNMYEKLSARDSAKKTLGGGDVKLMSAASLLLGFWDSLYALLIAAALAAVVYFAAKYIGQNRLYKAFKSKGIPLAPFISAGTLAVYIYTNLSLGG